MEELLYQLKTAIDNNLYYLALYTTLTLPDICSSLASNDQKQSGKQYIEWYNKYAFGKCSSRLDGYSCYKFRCSSLHEGNTQDKRIGYSRILFVEPSATNGSIFHDNVLNDALNIDLKAFCYGMIDAVMQWLSEVQNDPNFISNYSKFMKRYPKGIPPYIVGTSIIS